MYINTLLAKWKKGLVEPCQNVMNNFLNSQSFPDNSCVVTVAASGIRFIKIGRSISKMTASKCQSLAPTDSAVLFSISVVIGTGFFLSIFFFFSFFFRKACHFFMCLHELVQILSRDSVTVAVDAVVYYRVQNPTIAVSNVENFR